MKNTDCEEATEKIREEVRPGTPYIVYSTKPSVTVYFDNPIERSGLFTISVNIGENETTKSLKEKVAKIVGLKDLSLLKLWRYVNPIEGPRKIPAFGDYKTGKVILEDGTFNINLEKNEVFFNSQSGEKLLLGCNLIYVID